MYIIGMNGPPHCGKDSVANALAGIIAQQTSGGLPLRIALSQSMRETVYALAGLQYSESHYDLHKDKPQEIFNGRTIRQEMIDLSERHVKPRLGQDFWAKRADVAIKMWDDSCTIISDFGFTAEQQYFFQRYPTLTVRLTRDGTDWSKDSRGYLYGHGYQIDVSNNTTIQMAAEEIYQHCTVELGWTF